jgi:ABC-2 type transport system ATP-binding protein
MAGRVAVIDHGKIIGTGSPSELKSQTGTQSLEEAFLKLTGKEIRNEEAGDLDTLRTHARMWGRRR